MRILCRPEDFMVLVYSESQVYVDLLISYDLLKAEHVLIKNINFFILKNNRDIHVFIYSFNI